MNRRPRLITLLAVLAVIVAAGNSAYVEASRPRAAGGSTRGITDDSVKVGGLGYAPLYPDSAVGA